jgi:acetoacetyl-CoA reductase
MSEQKRTALVTGGMGGIGTAICRQLHDDGFAVVVTHTGNDKNDWLAAEKPREFFAYPCDVTSWESCEALQAAVLRDFPAGVDVLVNNAGITRDATFRKMTPAAWNEVIAANLTSVFNVSKQFVDGMTQRGYGRVICISSVNGQKGQFGQTNYAAAKAGMHGFVKSLAQETVKKGVTVNTVSPGYIGTRMVLAMPEETQDKIRANIPLGRFGTPEEIARLVAFLAAEDAGFITGANFSANGGQHMF